MYAIDFIRAIPVCPRRPDLAGCREGRQRDGYLAADTGMDLRIQQRQAAEVPGDMAAAKETRKKLFLPGQLHGVRPGASANFSFGTSKAYRSCTAQYSWIRVPGRSNARSCSRYRLTS